MGKHTQLTAIATLLLITALMASNLIAVQALSIDDIPKPSTPEFTVKYVDYSYDVPSTDTSTMNPYTGEVTNTTHQSYHVDKKTVDLIITNEPVPSSNKSLRLFYNVREKGHFVNEWNELYDYSMFTYMAMSPCDPSEPAQNTCPASNDKYTVISYYYNVGDQIDFQVQALYGYSSPSAQQHMLFCSLDYSYIRGEWSDTQTITVAEPASTPISNPKVTLTPTPSPTTIPIQNPTETPTQTTSPQQVEQSGVMFFLQNQVIIVLVVSCALIGVLIIALTITRRKNIQLTKKVGEQT